MRGAVVVLVIQFFLAVCAVAQGDARPNLDSLVAKANSADELPDAPSATMVEPVTPIEPRRQGEEILANDAYRPMTKHEKWDHFLRRSYAPATFVGAGEDTVYKRATGGFMYCCGTGAWGQQYAATLADKETRQFFGNFLFPVLLKQDPRYFPKRSGGLFGRALYAATRVLVTRNDNGRAAFNYSEILGVSFAKAFSNAYYPDRRRGGWETANRILGTFQSDATSNLMAEFWPEIKHIVNRCTPKRVQRLSLPDAPAQY